MNAPRNLLKIVWIGMAISAIALSSISPAYAQGDNPPKPVGWEVRSTNTPGGGGELKSQGVTGKKTPWFLVKNGPSVAGSAVVNIVIVYYDSKEDLEKAKELDKKKKEEEDAKKKGGKKDDGKKDDGKKDDGKKAPPKPKTKNPGDVVTFDPRTHRVDENGKVVPIDPKQKSPDLKDHKDCEKPMRFECGEHYRWWLENHEHRSGTSEKGGADRHRMQDRPRLIMTGSVLAGQPADVRVVDSNGAFLSGVVLALPNGEMTMTDEQGKATVSAPSDSGTLLVTLLGLGVAGSAWVQPSPGPTAIPVQPKLDPPSLLQPGQTAEIGWTGAQPGSTICIDGKPVQVLASSPTSCIIQVPNDLEPGRHVLGLTSGSIESHSLPMEEISFSDQVPVDSFSLSLEPPKTLMLGQKAAYTVRLIGTDKKVDLRLANLSPSVVRMLGSAAQGSLTTSGGRDNVARIDVQALSAGAIQIQVEAMPQTDVSRIKR